MLVLTETIVIFANPSKMRIHLMQSRCAESQLLSIQTGVCLLSPLITAIRPALQMQAEGGYAQMWMFLFYPVETSFTVPVSWRF